MSVIANEISNIYSNQGNHEITCYKKYEVDEGEEADQD